MSITIGSNTVSSNSGNNINCFKDSSNSLSFTSLGKVGQYPAFIAKTDDDNWRYGGQLGGVSNWRDTSTWTEVRGDWVAIDRSPGSYGFDTDTGRYYAPVTGYYKFGVTAYYGCETNNSQGYSHWNFLRNGATGFNGRHGHAIFGHDCINYHVDGLQVENVIYCTAGQYVCPGPYWGAGGYNRTYMGHFCWWGHLIP